MPDLEDAFSTLDDFLLSLAQGVSLAQAELAQANATGPAQSQFTYHLPRVDFELKMNLRVVEDEGLSHRYSKLKTLRLSNKHLLFRPLAAEESRATLEVAAVVRGSFVSVPRNDGLPATLLEASVDESNPAAPVVTVKAMNTAGEPVVGLPVELNIDREESAALTENSGLPFELESGTRFEQGVVTTDASGTAGIALAIDPKQKRAALVLLVDAGGQTETLVYEVSP